MLIVSLNRRASIGDIVFGMEDGTVSVFGLVFGVALSTNNRQVVLLARAARVSALVEPTASKSGEDRVGRSR